MFSSEHTRLINKFIGLCKDTMKWPSILSDLGYNVQLIEQIISIKKTAEKIKPDVVAVSNKYNHAIVVDCKSGKNIDVDQDKRYQNIESSDLTYYVTVHDKNRLSHCSCYVDNESNHTVIKPYASLPLVTFYKECIEGEGDFKLKQLNDTLCKKISLTGMYEPSSFYPFSPDDEDYQIVPHVLRGLISYLSRKGLKTRPVIQSTQTYSDILEVIHPFYANIEINHREQLTNKIEKMISMFIKSNEKFKEQISKIEKGDLHPATFKSLAEICEGIISDFEKQRKITEDYGS